ncbi:MAG: transporter substrate-binding protein [Pseudorhodoplanes sp.]
MVGTISALHYTETNKLPENAEMRAQLSKLFGAKGVTDIASVGAWDGVNLIYTALREVGASADGLTLIKAMTGKQLKSPRGPILIDPEERDIVQNIYIRRIEKVDGKLQNIDIATVEMMKDPWKLENPAKK